VKIAHFLLDSWLDQNAGAEFNLGGSTGPRWTPREILALAGGAEKEELLDLTLGYAPAAGSEALREGIAAMQGVPAEEVLVLAGSAEALFQIFFLAAEPGANVIIPFPNFPAHQTVPEALGFEIRHYHLRRENSYRINLDEVTGLADRNTKLLVVNSPHNPTGATLSDAEMKSLHDFCAERGVQFVCDEVFHPIYHGPETQSTARLPQATVVGDFSKALSLPGLRLGWIIERDRGRRAEYLNAREYISVSNTPMGEFLGNIAIRHHQVVLARTREVTGANLTLLDRVLAEHSDVLDWVRPQGGMTGFARLRAGGDGRRFCEKALERGVLLAPGDCWGLPDHIRIGFGMGQEWYPRAMTRFAELLHTQSRTAHATRG